MENCILPKLTLKIFYYSWKNTHFPSFTLVRKSLKSCIHSLHRFAKHKHCFKVSCIQCLINTNDMMFKCFLFLEVKFSYDTTRISWWNIGSWGLKILLILFSDVIQSPPRIMLVIGRHSINMRIYMLNK